MASANPDGPGQFDRNQRRRSEDRYAISAPVKFKWQTIHGTWRKGNGVTRDISGSGIFILSYPVPVPDAPIVLTLDVPSLSGATGPVVFQGRGRVLRIEAPHGHPLGFGASVVYETGQDECGHSRPAQDAKNTGDSPSPGERDSGNEVLPVRSVAPIETTPAESAGAAEGPKISTTHAEQ
jgi:hypothetical protein